jgi:hypothetical protein
VLTDTAGTPKPDGSYSLTFRLFAAPTGGSALWTETKSLSVKRGLFSTILGDTNPFGSALTFDDQYWLSIQVASQSQMSPRIPLTPVGYSLNSVKADTAQYARSAPVQGCVDSARTSYVSRYLHLPSSNSCSDPEFALQVTNGGTGDGIRAYSHSTASNYAAIYATNVATTGNGSGVYATSVKGAGLFASSNSADAVEATTYGTGKSAVYAHTSNGFGLTARSVNDFGAQIGGGGDGSLSDRMGDILLEGINGEIFSNGTQLDMYSNGSIAFDLDDMNNGSYEFFIYNDMDNAVFIVDEQGNTYATGTKSAMVHTDAHGDRLVYSTESPEVWFEDIGGSQLKGGVSRVQIEAVFAQTINAGVPYHVFVTPNADEPVLLFVAEKDNQGFTVKGTGLDGQPVDCSFDYRIVAKRRGYEGVRLATVDPLSTSKRAVTATSPVTVPEAPRPSPFKDKTR